MRIHQWGIGLSLVAWGLWTEFAFFPEDTPRMEEAFETKGECEAKKARVDKAWKSYEARALAGGHTPAYTFKSDYSCWPDTIDPRKK